MTAQSLCPQEDQQEEQTTVTHTRKYGTTTLNSNPTGMSDMTFAQQIEL